MANSPFGYAIKYASKAGGQTYTLPADPNTDNRFETDQEVIINGDGTYRFEDDQEVDFSILTSALFNEDQIIDNHGDLDADQGGRGYMMATTDWRDVEVDFMFKVEDYSADDGFRVYLGGGRHQNPQPFCEGCSYVFRYFYNGDIQWTKEQWHNYKAPVPSINTYQTIAFGDYNADSGIVEQAFEPVNNTWMLGKFVRYNVRQNDGKTAVKMEFYANTSGDRQTWVLQLDALDVSGWGSEGVECEGNADQVLTWAYPMIRFYWKNADRVDWFGLYIREIQPQAPVPPPPDPPPDDGDGTQPVPPEQPTGKVSKIGSFRFSIASTLATSCDGVSPTEPSTNPNPPPDPPPPPPPAQGGTLSFQFAHYWKVGS